MEKFSLAKAVNGWAGRSPRGGESSSEWAMLSCRGALRRCGQ